MLHGEQGFLTVFVLFSEIYLDCFSFLSKCHRRDSERKDLWRRV